MKGQSKEEEKGDSKQSDHEAPVDFCGMKILSLKLFSLFLEVGSTLESYYTYKGNGTFLHWLLQGYLGDSYFTEALSR